MARPNNKVTAGGYKTQTYGVAHHKALPHLAERAKRYQGKILPFPQARLVLSWLFRLSKEESWLFLKEMQSLGLIQMVPHRGIRILQEVRRDER